MPRPVPGKGKHSVNTSGYKKNEPDNLEIIFEGEESFLLNFLVKI